MSREKLMYQGWFVVGQTLTWVSIGIDEVNDRVKDGISVAAHRAAVHYFRMPAAERPEAVE